MSLRVLVVADDAELPEVRLLVGKLIGSDRAVRCVRVGSGDGSELLAVAQPVDLDDLIAARLDLGSGDAPVRAGDLLLEPAAGRVSVGDVELRLSPTELRVLTVLAASPGRVVSKHELLDRVWEYDFGGRTNVVETYVSYLRRKLAPFPCPSIATVRGAGYRLDC